MFFFIIVAAKTRIHARHQDAHLHNRSQIERSYSYCTLYELEILKVSSQTYKMAKDKSLSKEERKAAKKAAKTESALTESAGISKSKSEKKEKKDKKEKKAKLAAQLLDEVEKADGAVVEVKGDKKVVVSNVGADGEVVSDEDETMVVDSKGAVRPIGALVPFANPLADEKVAKKVFRGVKKGMCTFYFVLDLNW